MNRLFRYLAGSVHYRFTSPRPERILQVFLQKNLPVWGIKREREDLLSFSVLLPRARRIDGCLSELLPGEAIERERRGLLQLLYRYRKRYGFFAGGVLTAVLFAFVSSYLWGVRIVGNRTVSDETLREQLSLCGIGAGVKIRTFDRDKRETEFLLAHPEYSYFSVNVIGTVARVEVRERGVTEEKRGFEGTSNLVASKAGRILRYEVSAGQIEVKPGESVAEGALLVSGVVENKNGAFRTVRAKGRVFAETEETFEVFVPLEYEEIVFTGKERSFDRYSALGVSFSFSGADCPFDQVRETSFEEPLEIFGFELPVLRERRVFRECVTVKNRISVDRAENLAYDKYSRYKRESLPPDTGILQEKTEILREDGGVRLIASLVLSQDIAKEAPFRVTP